MSRRSSSLREGEDVFSLSIGDLMASLLMLFSLLLISSLFELRQKDKQVQVIAEEFVDQQKLIALELNREFSKDLDKWGATLDSQRLIIRFKEPDILFESGRADLKPRFEEVLEDFFPRYVQVLNQSNFRSYIEEIRIEGHTDSDGNYWYNMQLAQDRTRTTAEFCIKTLYDANLANWVQKLLTANGMSYSHPILDSLGNEDKVASRRVEFRVKSTAEIQLRRILDTWHNNPSD